MTEVFATLKNAKVSSQKARLVANQIRGKHVDEALNFLIFNNQKSSGILKKVLESAVANAINNKGLNEDTLFVSGVTIDESYTMKRIRPRARGRADRYFKRSCNIRLTLKEGQ